MSRKGVLGSFYFFRLFFCLLALLVYSTAVFTCVYVAVVAVVGCDAALGFCVKKLSRGHLVFSAFLFEEIGDCSSKQGMMRAVVR